MQPSSQPSSQPSAQPTGLPTMQPTGQPSRQPTSQPSRQPTGQPTGQPSRQPTGQPTGQPSRQPTGQPTSLPTGQPSSQPSGQPSQTPTGQPSFIKDNGGIHTVTPAKDYIRVHGKCEHSCSGHGYCYKYTGKCECFKNFYGDDEYTGVDCSLRACPKGNAWAYSTLSNNNDAHPWVECSDRGHCNRDTGECECARGFEGMACQRNTCFNDCSNRGVCTPQKVLAENANRVYSTPWDAMKIWGCVCDIGSRGPDCSLLECPSSSDPIGGYGNESGRDCSGRGICNYNTGRCTCFGGFHGSACDIQSVVE